jgi:hypothetical protein
MSVTAQASVSATSRLRLLPLLLLLGVGGFTAACRRAVIVHDACSTVASTLHTKQQQQQENS